MQEPRAVEVQLIGAPPGTRALPEPPTLAQARQAHPFLQAAGQGGLRIASGTHDVKGDLVLPAGVALTVEAGAVLRFEPDAVLLARGPVHLRGSEQAPVQLTARGHSFGGVFVSEAGAQSVWTHARVSKTTGVARPGFRATGGVTFYRSPVTLADCRFEDSLGEDAVNVIRSSVEMRRTHFARTKSDAFDGDWVRGTLRDVSFEDVAGDGVDVSGSELDISDLRARKIGDKALSAGEESRVTARRLSIEHARFAVASKDLSHVTVEGAAIVEAQVGWAAYRKKHEFGPAHIEAREVTMERVEAPSLCELDSGVQLDGVKTTCEEFAVRPFMDNPAATPPPAR
jgi:hypothetical protein